MRRKYVFLLLLVLSMMVFGEEAPLRRVVYLWDVTYSMHGGYLGNNEKDVVVANQPMHIHKYAVDYDIYDRIVEALIQSIDKWGAEDEIIIVPFNAGVLVHNIEDWRRRGDESGKRYLMSKIRNFYNSDQTYTNICDPLSFSNSLFDGSLYPQAKEGELNILTDGVHNVKNPSRKRFFALLDEWCDFAEKYNVKGRYFLLTDQAIKDKELKEKIKKDDNCWEFVKEYQLRKYTIAGNRIISVMEGEYDKPIPLSIKPEEACKPIYGCEQVRIYAEPNKYFSLDQTITIDENTTTIDVQPTYKMSLLDLKSNLPTDKNCSVTIHFEQIKKSAQEESAEVKNLLTTHSCTWEFVNKAQKTLTIKMRKK